VPVSETALTPRPLLRGTLHQAGFFVACAVGTVFVSTVEGRRLVAAAVFAASAVAMLGASALYHRVAWSAPAHLWMRRVDHAGIYVLIAGTYTAVGLLALHGSLQHVVLGLVSSKVPDLESAESLKGRIKEAEKHIALDQLCLSPQCGFASNFLGNPLTVADEEAKLRRIVEVADSVWH